MHQRVSHRLQQTSGFSLALQMTDVNGRSVSHPHADGVVERFQHVLSAGDAVDVNRDDENSRAQG